MTLIRKATLGVVAALCCTVATGSSHADETFSLLSIREIATRAEHFASHGNDLVESQERELQALGGARSLALKRNEGPIITVHAPSGFALNSPVDFDVQFQPRDGIEVDMTSIRIDYRLGPLWTNVTQRITRHSSIAGTRLRAGGAELPSGDHLIRLRVFDTADRETMALISFTVGE